MSPARKTAIPLEVDLDGTEVIASLRPPRSAKDNYRVRWRVGTVTYERSTGINVLAEAKRVARMIIRGEPIDTRSVTPSVGLTVAEFERVQAEHYGRNARPEAEGEIGNEAKATASPMDEGIKKLECLSIWRWPVRRGRDASGRSP